MMWPWAATSALQTAARRQRHPKKEWEALLREAEKRGWRVHRQQGYFKVYCPCADKHKTCIPLTPSVSKTLVNKRKWFERQPCWRMVTE
jgi:hypothetical protein